MKIFGAIFTCILLGYFWIWLIQHIFAKQQKKLSRRLFWTSFLLAWSLLAFSFLLDAVFPNLNSIEDGAISLSWWWCFLLYCALIFLFLIFINWNWRIKQIRFLFAVRTVLFAVVWLFGIKVWISASILYYFVLAYAEEFLKIWATENKANKTDFYSSDLLFFSIFIALGFSIVENIFYIWKEIFASDMTGMFALVFGRGIFTSLLHFIATGVIALVLYKFYQQVQFKNLSLTQKIVRIVVALLVGVLIHWGYNLAIQHANFLVYILLVFGGYLLLTYLLFLSDSLYTQKESKE